MIKNKNILIDTNVLYYLIKKDINGKINMNYLEDFIKNNKIHITIFSIFELLNNKEGYFKYKKEIDQYLEKDIKTIYTKKIINERIGLLTPKDIATMDINDLKDKKHLMGKMLSKLYASQISFYCAAAFSGYLDLFIFFGTFDNDPRYNDIKTKIINYTNRIVNLFKNILYKQFNILNNNEELTEKNMRLISRQVLLNIISTIIPYFNDLLTNFIKPYRYYNILNKLADWNRQLNIDRLELSIDYTEVIKGINIIKFLEQVTKSKDIGERLIDMIMAQNVMVTDKYDFEFDYYRKYLKEILNGNFSLKSNNIIDSINLDGFFKSKNLDYFLTFDKNMIKIIQNSKEPKIIKTINFINEFYF